MLIELKTRQCDILINPDYIISVKTVSDGLTNMTTGEKSKPYLEIVVGSCNNTESEVFTTSYSMEEFKLLVSSALSVQTLAN